MKVKSLSRVRLFVTPWTVAYQASLSMDFPGILQEYKQKGALNALEWWVFERKQMKNGYGNKRGQFFKIIILNNY